MTSSQQLIFGVRNGELSEAEQALRTRVAREHECEWIYAELADGWRSWFTAERYGDPWDRSKRAEVLAALDAARASAP